MNAATRPDQTCRLVVVEDEWIALRGLTETVDWSRYKLELVGFHRNGRQCLDALETEQPEVIVTDIRMPVMDGLELLREVGRTHPEIVVVLLSGHEEFEYARQGLQDGAAGYLRKASLDADLEAFSPELQRRLALARDQGESAAQDQLQTLRRTEAIRRVLFGEARGPARRNGSHELCALLAIRVSAGDQARVEAEVRTHATELAEHLTISGAVECLSTVPQELVLVLTDLTGEPKGVATRLRTLAVRLQHDLAARYAGTPAVGIVIGIGSAGYGLSSLRDSLGAARLATDLQRPTDRVCLGGVRSRPLRSQAPAPEPDDTPNSYRLSQDEIAAALIHGNRSEVETLLARTRTRVNAREVVSLNSLLGEVEEFVGSVYRRVESWRPETKLLLPDIHELIAAVAAASTIVVLLEEFERIVRAIGESLAAVLATPAIRNVLAAATFIEDHLEEHVTLADAAARAGISPSHFSVVFKRAMGTTFSDYLTDVRLRRAHALLRSGHGVRQTRELVGYTDDRHFRTLFKRRFGVTPREIE